MYFPKRYGVNLIQRINSIFHFRCCSSRIKRSDQPVSIKESEREDEFWTDESRANGKNRTKSETKVCHKLSVINY